MVQKNVLLWCFPSLAPFPHECGRFPHLFPSKVCGRRFWNWEALVEDIAFLRMLWTPPSVTVQFSRIGRGPPFLSRPLSFKPPFEQKSVPRLPFTKNVTSPSSSALPSSSRIPRGRFFCTRTSPPCPTPYELEVEFTISFFQSNIRKSCVTSYFLSPSLFIGILSLDPFIASTLRGRVFGRALPSSDSFLLFEPQRHLVQLTSNRFLTVPPRSSS